MVRRAEWVIIVGLLTILSLLLIAYIVKLIIEEAVVGLETSVNELETRVKGIGSEMKTQLSSLQSAVNGIDEKLQGFERRIYSLEINASSLKTLLEELQEETKSLAYEVKGLKSEVASIVAENQALKCQASELAERVAFLVNQSCIIQSEKYLARINGSYVAKGGGSSFTISKRTAHFIPLGRELKVKLRVWGTSYLSGSYAGFGNSHVEAYYVHEGKSVVVDKAKLSLAGGRWWLPRGKFSTVYNETAYLSLHSILPEVFGRVPIYVKLSLEVKPSSYCSQLVYWEVTVYDLYPP